MTSYVRAETDWEKARLGRFTSSEIDKLFTLPRSAAARLAGELGGTAKSYIRSRAAEIITGLSKQVLLWSFEWGNKYEPAAAERLLDIYPHMEYKGKANPVFLPLTDFSGGSPDCWEIIHRPLVTEIKCPVNPENHIINCLLKSGAELLATRRATYRQLQMNMICVANKFGIAFEEMKGIFCSYCPIVQPGYMDLKVLEIEPDMEFYERLPIILTRAEGELAELVWDLRCREQQSKLIAA